MPAGPHVYVRAVDLAAMPSTALLLDQEALLDVLHSCSVQPTVAEHTAALLPPATQQAAAPGGEGSKGGGQQHQPPRLAFLLKHLNIMDPLLLTNNLGR